MTRRGVPDGQALSLAGLPRARAQQPDAMAGGFGGQTDALLAPAPGLRDAPHHLRDAGAELDDGVEGLVVVGARPGALAEAWRVREHAGRPVRMPVPDALDPIGGLAPRSEFVARYSCRGVGVGASQPLDTLRLFSPATPSLPAGVGIDRARLKTGLFEHGWAERHGPFPRPGRTRGGRRAAAGTPDADADPTSRRSTRPRAGTRRPATASR